VPTTIVTHNGYVDLSDTAARWLADLVRTSDHASAGAAAKAISRGLGSVVQLNGPENDAVLAAGITTHVGHARPEDRDALHVVYRKLADAP